MALYYCKKCGRILDNTRNKDVLKCDCCSTTTEPVPKELLNEKVDCFFKDKETEQKFIEEHIKTSPEFDQYLFEHRDEILSKKSTEFNAKMEQGRAILEGKSQVPKCPTCQSTNIKKIGELERTGSIAIFGLFSKKINKTFKCNNCGYTW